MNKIDVEISPNLKEKVFKTTLANGLTVYICKKEGFNKKIGMFGTKYGSVINEFIDINTNEKVKVPDGVAHFLEHKLFEQEGANALDLFSKIGVSSNAYTSFDQTVYFFETSNKYEESLELLIKLVSTPYFTDENVQKEQGIIGQEISMYDDEPNYKVYFNALQAMYHNNPVRIDIAGTIESISHITKETLYTCYNTFYNLSNMFFVVIGDVNIEDTIDIINKNLEKYNNKKISKEVTIFNEAEPKNVHKKKIEKNMDIYLQQLCIGFKLNLSQKEEIVKRQILADIISEMYFSKLSTFYKEQYRLGLINEDLSFMYEGTKYFSHIVIMGETTNVDMLSKNVVDYIEKIKQGEIDENLFELVKKKKIGEMLLMSDSLDSSYRRIIDSILSDTDVYCDFNLLQNLTSKDIKEFLNELLPNENMVISTIKSK